MKVNAVLAAAEAEVKAEAAAAAAAVKRRMGQMTAALERKAADIRARAEAWRRSRQIFCSMGRLSQCTHLKQYESGLRKL